MGKIVFADSWQPVFAEFGLTSFDDFFRFTGGRRMNKNSRRDVTISTFGDTDHSKLFFLKRFHNPHFKDMLFTLCNFGHLCSQAAYEWKNANILLENGVATYRPVCYGEQTKLGLERRSFIMTEKLPSRPLTDFVRENWQHLRTEQKKKIIVDLAGFVRKIHNLNISLPDLYLWHIFIREAPGAESWEFAVIDLHRMMHNVTSKDRQIKNLGALYHSMLDKYFDDTLRQVFIESYAGRNWPGSTASLAIKVKKYSDAVSAKRNPRQY